ncbi:MAG: DUF1232 domain-containing protein [Chloroflexi bacterium]|nr:DUF1232 domain-containing protein [Chloroflexota bacterium]
MPNLKSWKEKVKQLHAEVYVLFLAFKDPRTPWYARVFMAMVLAYFLSPLDLIPDFIPVLGYVDDLVIVPAGIYLARKMIPGGVLEEYRQKARSEPVDNKFKWGGAVIIILVWILVLYLLIRFIWKLFH